MVSSPCTGDVVVPAADAKVLLVEALAVKKLAHERLTAGQVAVLSSEGVDRLTSIVELGLFYLMCTRHAYHFDPGAAHRDKPAFLGALFHLRKH